MKNYSNEEEFLKISFANHIYNLYAYKYKITMKEGLRRRNLPSDDYKKIMEWWELRCVRAHEVRVSCDADFMRDIPQKLNCSMNLTYLLLNTL